MLIKQECDRLNSLLETLVDDNLLCGYNVAVVTPDEEAVYTYGYRQTVPEKIPADRNTRYDLASLSKVVSTTCCILKLVEEGKLTLDTPVYTILPQVHNREITVMDCLTHTTGMPANIDNYKTMTEEEFQDAIFNAPVDPKVKGTVLYSDINFIWLGKIVDKLAGSLKDYAAEKVFEPLGMKHTCYCPEDRNNIAATEVTKDRGVICGEVHDGKAYRLNGISGSAGVFSCIDDIIRFVRMMMDDSNDFFPPETREMFRTCYADKGADRRSVGWIISTDKATMGCRYSPHTLFHTGFTGGSVLIDLDRKISLIILCNRVHPSRNNSSILKFRDVLNTLVYRCQEV